MHSFRNVKYKCGASKAGLRNCIYWCCAPDWNYCNLCKEDQESRHIFGYQIIPNSRKSRFPQGSQQTRFFYNILVLKDIRLTAAVKVIEFGGICSSGSFAALQTGRRHKEGTVFDIFFFSHTLLDSRNMTPDSWSFILASTFIVIVSYLYIWSSFQLLKAFNAWTVIKLFWYELI